MARIQIWGFNFGNPDNQKRTIDDWIYFVMENEPKDEEIRTYTKGKEKE